MYTRGYNSDITTRGYESPYYLPDAAEPVDLLTGLYAYYRGDDNMQDSSGNGRHLTALGETYSTGKINNGLATSSGSLAGIWTALNVQDYSISGWFYGTPGSDGIYRSRASFGLSNFKISHAATGSSGGVNLVLSDTIMSVPAVDSIPLNVWNHIVITWDHVAVEYKCYVNGVSQAINSLGFSANGTAPSSLTWDSNATRQSPSDEMGIWTICLSQAQVNALYNGGAGFDPTA
jgi:hypothetical protein